MILFPKMIYKPNFMLDKLSVSVEASMNSFSSSRKLHLHVHWLSQNRVLNYEFFAGRNQT